MTFHPNRLQYDQNGVPVLSRVQIEDIAEELLSIYCPRIFETPIMTPVAEILETLQKKTRLTTAFADLGYIGEKKLLGSVSIKNRLLRLDSSLLAERERSFRFVTGHEIGHWVLHRYRPISLDDIDDDEDSFQPLSETKHLSTGRDWTEYQANAFAAALVLPQAPLRKAIIAMQQEIGITRNLGVIYVNNSVPGAADVAGQLEILRSLFDVSQTALKYRLLALRWLIGYDTPRIKA